MDVRLGTLLPGAEAIGFGKNKAKRGFALFADGAEQSVIVKAVPAIEIAVEIFCATLGRGAGLQIPEPMVIKDPSNGSILFGALDAGYPNLLQQFNIKGTEISDEEVRNIAYRLVQWSKLGQGVCFDEWISNVDRNLQNLLWDGYDNFVLIDHGYALGQAPRGHPDQNLLLEVSLRSCDDSDKKDKLRERVLSAVKEFEVTLAQEAARTLQGAPHLRAADDGQIFLQFVQERYPQLAGLLVRRFPSDQLSLI
jgi:hypothetical protein